MDPQDKDRLSEMASDDDIDGSGSCGASQLADSEAADDAADVATPPSTIVIGSESASSGGSLHDDFEEAMPAEAESRC